MLMRNILLGLGMLAMLAGGVLVVIWLREPAPQVAQETAPALRQGILVTARPLRAGTLLAAADMRWKDIPAAEVAQGNILRGQASEQDFAGAVALRDFQSGEALAEAQLMKPSQGGFLAAVLAPSMRAVSITVGAAESVSGLIAPGDHVDVILTQSFESATTESGRKSVGETMLHGVRVVAVDQTLNGGMQPNGIAPVAAQPRIPKTITLEVTEHQAEMLMVATQIGKVDLAMRPYADDAAARQLASSEALNLPPPDDPSPTWASDVSSALRGRNPMPARSASSNAPHSRTLPSIAVMRGSKIETLCSGGDRLEACGESK